MKDQLTTARDILLTTRIHAVADRWHLTERAVPALTAEAGRTGDPHLHRALEHTAKAGELLHAARNSLAEASAQVEQLVPWPAVTSAELPTPPPRPLRGAERSAGSAPPAPCAGSAAS